MVFGAVALPVPLTSMDEVLVGVPDPPDGDGEADPLDSEGLGDALDSDGLAEDGSELESDDCGD